MEPAISLQPKIYADKYRLVMVFPATWTCEGCGFRWASDLKRLDVNAIVTIHDENECPKCHGHGKKAKERQVVYRDRRCGVTWPGPINPGYLVVFGIRDEPSPTVYQQTDMLVEAMDQNIERFFDKLIAAMQKLHCSWVLCDRSSKHDTTLYTFGRHLLKRNVQLQILDMSEIGGFEEARPVVDDMMRNNQLHVPSGTELRKQSGRLTPIDLHTKDRVGPEERFWAVNAMNFVLVSWTAYPWKRPGKQVRPDIRRR